MIWMRNWFWTDKYLPNKRYTLLNHNHSSRQKCLRKNDNFNNFSQTCLSKIEMDFVRAVASLDFVSERGLNSDYEYNFNSISSKVSKEANGSLYWNIIYKTISKVSTAQTKDPMSSQTRWVWGLHDTNDNVIIIGWYFLEKMHISEYSWFSWSVVNPIQISAL